MKTLLQKTKSKLKYRITHTLSRVLISLVVAGVAGLGVFSSGAFSGTSDENALHGRVVYVADGDTLDILTPEKKTVRVRLWGIDAPEKSQPHGQEAKHYLTRVAYDCTATVEVMDVDRYGRTVGLVHACGSDVNETMVEAGYAWVYEQYAAPPYEARWEALEAQARKTGKGLWRDARAVPPWEWRRQH